METLSKRRALWADLDGSVWPLLVSSGFFCTKAQRLILLQPPRRTAASSALTVSRKQSSIFLNAILYLIFFPINWAIASWLCEVHDFPDAQETEPKEQLGPGFRASWGSMAGSRKLRSCDSCSSEWARLHTHCEGSLRIWLWVTPIFEYGISKLDEGDENYMVKPILFGKHKAEESFHPAMSLLGHVVQKI